MQMEQTWFVSLFLHPFLFALTTLITD